MVYRKRTYRKRPYGRKRTYRRRFKRSFRYNKRGTKVFLYKRFCSLGTIAADSTLDQFAAYSFELNNLPGFAEFTSLYDFYKINAVKISFIPTQTVSNSLSTISNAQNSRFFSVIDYNDDTAPTSLDELRQYASCRYTSIFRTHKRYIYKPKYSIQSYVQSRQWINTATPSTEWYGLKIGIEAMGSTVSTSMNYRVEAKYYVSFKNPK